MALWAEETIQYIAKYGESKIYTLMQHAYDIIHFEPFRSRKDNI